MLTREPAPPVVPAWCVEQVEEERFAPIPEDMQLKNLDRISEDEVNSQPSIELARLNV